MAVVTPRALRIGKPLLFASALVPFLLLCADIVNDELGPNPIETLNRYTGDWTLRFLLLTLAVTPLRQLTGWHLLIRFRRMIGLFAFFYACLHFLSWIWLDRLFDWPEIVKDVYKRPFITIGVVCFLVLIALAATSTNGMIKRLGGRRWRNLHRLVYASAIGGVLHFLWLVKSDITQPVIYGSILALLLGYRIWSWRRRAHFPAVARSLG